MSSSDVRGSCLLCSEKGRDDIALPVPVGICSSRAGVPDLLRVVVCHTMTVCCPKDLGLCVNSN